MPVVQVLYFEPDKKKDGGSYVEFSGNIKRVKALDGVLLTSTDIEIPFAHIVELSSEIFAPLDSLEY